MWADRLLNTIQTSFSSTQRGGDSEEKESQDRSAYRVMFINAFFLTV